MKRTLCRFGPAGPSERGFTLTELTVVLAILATLATISGAFMSRVSSGNRLIVCQSNLSQIFQALRMYRLDEGGYPAYNPTAPTASQGLGLWSLYTYGVPTDRMKGGIQGSPPAIVDTDPSSAGADGKVDGIVNPTVAAPVQDGPRTSYLTSPKSLHCPSERTHPVTPHPETSTAPYDLDYLYNSYQWVDSVTGEFTYLPSRTTSTSDANYTRQLTQPFPAEDTVITWCLHHRGEAGTANKKDLVLFMDGHVDLLDQTDLYKVPDTTGCDGKKLVGTFSNKGWQRFPACENLSP